MKLQLPIWSLWFGQGSNPGPPKHGANDLPLGLISESLHITNVNWITNMCLDNWGSILLYIVFLHLENEIFSQPTKLSIDPGLSDRQGDGGQVFFNQEFRKRYAECFYDFDITLQTVL